MISAYQLLNSYYSQGANTDLSKADFYKNRTDHFSDKNLASAELQNGALGYLYADPSGEQVFYDNPFWLSASGQSAASTAWAYFNLKKFNPFMASMKVDPEIFSGFHVTASTDFERSGSQELSISADQDKKATINWDNRSFEGNYDAIDQSILIENTQIPGLNYSETWRSDLTKTAGPSGDEFSVSSFKTEQTYMDSSMYTRTYNFSENGLLGSQIFDQSLPFGDVLNSSTYEYAQISEKDLLKTVDTTATFNGSYGYGSRFVYDYDPLGTLTSITVTQETRNDPLTRILETYRLIFDLEGSVEIGTLDKQILPSL